MWKHGNKPVSMVCSLHVKLQFEYNSHRRDCRFSYWGERVHDAEVVVLVVGSILSPSTLNLPYRMTEVSNLRYKALTLGIVM